MQFPQEDYGFNPAEGYEGSIVEYLNGYESRTGRAEVAIRFGLPVVRGTAADDFAIPTAALVAPAADADGWVTAAGAGVLGAGAEVLQDADWDGVQGITPLLVSRKGSIVINNHADWDATSDIVFEYISDHGALIQETFDVSDAGNQTFTTSEFMVRPVRASIGAGSGTNRTITIGWGADLGSLHAAGIACRDKTVVQPATPVGFPIGTEVAAARNVIFLALVENAVGAGAPAFVRLTAAGAEVAGAFRGDRDGTDAVPLIGATFMRAGAAASLVPVRYQWAA